MTAGSTTNTGRANGATAPLATDIDTALAGVQARLDALEHRREVRAQRLVLVDHDGHERCVAESSPDGVFTLAITDVSDGRRLTIVSGASGALRLSLTGAGADEDTRASIDLAVSDGDSTCGDADEVAKASVTLSAGSGFRHVEAAALDNAEVIFSDTTGRTTTP